MLVVEVRSYALSATAHLVSIKRAALGLLCGEVIVFAGYDIDDFNPFAARIDACILLKANASNVVNPCLAPGFEIQTQGDSQPMGIWEGFLAFGVSPDARCLRMLFLTLGGELMSGLIKILAVTVPCLLETSQKSIFVSTVSG